MKHNARTIAVKIYMSADAYLSAKRKCTEADIPMSSAGNLAFRQWQPAHLMRRAECSDRPAMAPKRALLLPSRAAGRVPLRV